MPPQKKSRSKKAGGRSKSAKTAGRYSPIALFGLLLLLVFLLASLLYLSYVRRPLPSAPPVSPPTVVLPPPAVPAEPAEPAGPPAQLFDDIRGEVESALEQGGLDLSRVKTSRTGDLLQVVVPAPLLSAKHLDELSLRLLLLESGLRLEVDEEAGEFRIFRGQAIICRVLFRRQPPPPSGKGAGRIAIIMDDLGRDLETAKALLAIDLPISFAILPGETRASQVAALAHRAGREVMIHIPMEPQNYPATNPGTDALLLGQSPEEIRARFQGFVERVPHAVGGNNHMGSRFTEYREGMAVVLAAMKDTGLFFVDSRTTAHSVALDEARQAGVPAAGRDVFLDNEQDVELIAREIRKLVVVARRQGQAVGICHPYPQTLEALRREASYLRAQQVELVPVSRLVVR